MRRSDITMIIVVLGILSLIGFMFYEDSKFTSFNESPKVALIFPVSGDFSTHGSENFMAAKLGVEDFNNHLNRIGMDWQLDATSVIVDTEPNNILNLMKELKADNYNLIIGPETSAQVSEIKSFVNDNGILVISPSSTAPSLALVDNVYRLSPDDTNQGQAITALLHQDEIKAIVLLTRDDTWGRDLQNSIKESFLIFGNGNAGMPIMYDTQNPEYYEKIQKVSEEVAKYQSEYGYDEIAVIVLGFGESTEFLKLAAQFDNLDDVKWFGTDSNANEKKITSDVTSLEFANKVDFTAVQFGSTVNPIRSQVMYHMYGETGEKPSTYAFSSYDAVWLLGNSIIKAQSTDPADIQKVIHNVAKDYDGALGNIELNEAGDLKSANYDIWGIVDDKWNIVGQYIHDTGKIEMHR